MDFVGKIAQKALESKFGSGSGSSHQDQNQGVQQSAYYPPDSAPGSGSGYYYHQPEPPAPPAAGQGSDLPYPWVARWDEREMRCFYLNKQTGEVSWFRPGEGGGGSYGPQAPPSYGEPPYGQLSYGEPYGQPYGDPYAQPYGYEPPRGEEEQSKKSHGHGLAYGAAGAAAGLLGGAVLAHEGEKIYDNFEEEKQDAEEFPEDAARWTGEKVEDAADDVQNFPENAAEWTGERVGAVEQFGDDMAMPMTRGGRRRGRMTGPFAGLLLADYGASVLRIDRPDTPSADQLTRHKTSIAVDLRNASSREVLLSLLTNADILIDPFRPGVLERLGLSPSEVLLKHNPRLIVARMTGFRRDGKYKDMAGHDINYIAVSGVLAMLGRDGHPPYAPGNILGDFAGGGAMCFLGILLALLSRSRSGRGQVVEANMVDGSAYLAAFPRLNRGTPLWGGRRGTNVLDGGSPFYDTYETKDRGRYFAVGALEPKFYAVLLKGLGFAPGDVPDRDDRANWPKLREIFARRFAEKTRDEWEAVFDGTDACATPVLENEELESAGYEQRPAVHLVDTPGRPIRSDDGGWSGGGLEPGTGGEETLR
ncbi:Alpha-methylacyl-CoA racemase, partial [Aspergillus sp. HF37]